MSSRSTRKSAATLEVEPNDELDGIVTTGTDLAEIDVATLEAPVSGCDGAESSTADGLPVEAPSPGTDTPATDSGPSDTTQTSAPANTAEALSTQLDQLVRSVGLIEELSRRARETAADDLARYDALLGSEEQYTRGLEQACTIRDQARRVRERAFGAEARTAAEPLVLDADRVLQAFTDLAAIWQQQASTFLVEHPDVELLLAERRIDAEEARRREAAAGHARELKTLLESASAALKSGILHEGKRLLAVLERQFPEETTAIEYLRLQVRHAVRAEKDAAARKALVATAEHQARGDFEAAVRVLEGVDVDGLSRDLSEDVFGRWCDACSRLSQTGGVTLVRDARTQGRGVIYIRDPLYPNGLVVFSSLGMGDEYPEGRVVARPSVLRRARGFREASPPPASSWPSSATSTAAPAPRGPVHH
jgi:hypothetical protein